MKLESLSNEQLELIPKVREEWLEIAVGGTKNLQLSNDIIEDVHWLYRLCEIKTKPIVLIADSPYQAQEFANYVIQDKKLQKIIRNYSQVGSQVYSQVG